MHKYTVITPRGKQQFTTDGRFIMGADLQTSAINCEAARLAVFTLAGEADRNIIRAEQWARAGLNHCQRVEPSNPPSAPAALHTANLSMQAQMCAMTGESNYLRAHDVLMAAWLAKHPNPETKPAPQPRPFAPMPIGWSHDETTQTSAQRVPESHDATLITSPQREKKLRHVLTIEDRRKAGRTTASKPAPTGRACRYCGLSSNGFASHLAFAGHVGFCGFARKYAGGDRKLAGDLLSRKGLSVIDPMPRNGAWQRGSDLSAAA